METAEQMEAAILADREADSGDSIQAAGFLLELSLDWIVLRASQNIHHLLGKSHVTLIEEPLGRFVHAQALHDLRNLFSRLSATTGIGRAYGIRLTDDPDRFDVSFQLSDGRVILEAVPSTGVFGECFGSVGGLVSGLASAHGQTLLDSAARRMRALTGYDRVTLKCGNGRAESSRGPFAAQAALADDLPMIIADVDAPLVQIYPHESHDRSVAAALMRSTTAERIQKLRDEGVRACLRVPFTTDDVSGEFRCDSRTSCEPNFELHAAAELFAQLFAMRLEIDRLRNAN